MECCENPAKQNRFFLGLDVAEKYLHSERMSKESEFSLILIRTKEIMQEGR